MADRAADRLMVRPDLMALVEAGSLDEAGVLAAQIVMETGQVQAAPPKAPKARPARKRVGPGHG